MLLSLSLPTSATTVLRKKTNLPSFICRRFVKTKWHTFSSRIPVFQSALYELKCLLLQLLLFCTTTNFTSNRFSLRDIWSFRSISRSKATDFQPRWKPYFYILFGQMGTKNSSISTSQSSKSIVDTVVFYNLTQKYTKNLNIIERSS